MSNVEVNDINVHYWQVGEGPDVVMVHGLLGNLAVWHLRMVPLMRDSYKLTTLDMRGHGFTTRTPKGYTTKELAGDLEGLLDSLGIEKAHIVGHSFGADVCLHFAIMNPQRVDKLVLIEPGLAALVHERMKSDWVGWDFWVGRLAEVGVEVPPEKYSDFQYLLNLSLDTPKFYGPAKSLPRKRGPLLRLVNETSLVDDYQVIAGMTLELISAFRHPTLLVYGSDSYFMGTFDYLREVWPHAQSVILHGGGHFGPLEEPEKLVELMDEFFKSPDPMLEQAETGD